MVCAFLQEFNFPMHFFCTCFYYRFSQFLPQLTMQIACRQSPSNHKHYHLHTHTHTHIYTHTHTYVYVPTHTHLSSSHRIDQPYRLINWKFFIRFFFAAAANDVFFVALLPIFFTDCSCHLSPFDKTPWHNEESTLSQRRFGQAHLQYRTTLPAVCIVPAALDVPMPHPGVAWILNHKPRASPFPIPVLAFLHTLRSDGSLAFSMMWHKWQCA